MRLSRGRRAWRVATTRVAATTVALLLGVVAVAHVHTALVSAEPAANAHPHA